MKLERIVQVHIAALATLGAVLLGMGQRSPTPALLTGFAAFTSVIFSDGLNWFYLNRLVANVIALLALFFSLNDFFQTDMRAQLLAIGNLLVYLQVLLFYQRKNPRLYWQLTVLSLLQVVVSAALSVGLEFGLVLMLYAVTAFSSLAVLHVHRECLRTIEFSVRSRIWHGGENWLEFLTGDFPTLTDVIDKAGDFARPGDEGRDGGKRRAAGGVARGKADAAGRSAKTSRSALRREVIIRPLVSPAKLGQQVLSSGLLKQSAMIGLCTLVFAFVLFFTAPRLDSSTRRSYQNRATRVVGFSSEVSLDGMCRVLESSDSVMRASFRDAVSGEPYRVYGEPYFRGAILTEYRTGATGAVWRQPSSRPLTDSFEVRAAVALRPLQSPPSHRGLVRQDVTLQPLNEPALFAIFPVYASPQTPEDVRMHSRTEQLLCGTTAEERVRGEYRYAIVTTGLLGGVQLDVTPLSGRTTDLLDPELLAFDAERFPTLKETAENVIASHQVGAASRADIARALRDHFLYPGAYNYSLDLSRILRRREVDPIEDFVASHHTGHCQYFASALVMMLRSQGIPARMVVGFRGGEYNSLGDYYHVLQRHAHAWVEAYLPADEARAELPPEAHSSELGGWLRLDPTPGSDIDRARQLQQGWMDVVDDVLDYASTVWTEYILGLTAKRQRESIYEPVANRATPETWATTLARLRGLRQWLRAWMERLSMLVGIVLAAGLAIGLIFFGRRWLTVVSQNERRPRWRWGRNRQSPVAVRPTTHLTVLFYQRLEAALGRLQITRGRGQTPRELASRAAQRLAELAPQAAVALAPSRIVETFYRVRFGAAELPEPEGRAVENELARLEDAVRQIIERPPGEASKHRSH